MRNSKKRGYAEINAFGTLVAIIRKSIDLRLSVNYVCVFQAFIEDPQTDSLRYVLVAQH